MGIVNLGDGGKGRLASLRCYLNEILLYIKIAMKIRCVITGHRWKGCLCEACGQSRDEGHVWQPDANEPCKYHCQCGLHEYRHDWVQGVCRRCLTPAPPNDPLRPFDASPYDSAMTAHWSMRNLPSQSNDGVEMGKVNAFPPGGGVLPQKHSSEAPPAPPPKPNDPIPPLP
jgi:hypothetical protein